MAAKLVYLRNTGLILEIIYYQWLIGRGGGNNAVLLLERPAKRAARPLSRETIDDCVNFGLRLGAMAGLLNSCVTRSVIRCLLMRRGGVDARVAFGLNVGQGNMDGHCWVIEPGGGEAGCIHGKSNFDDLQIFPRE